MNEIIEGLTKGELFNLLESIAGDDIELGHNELEALTDIVDADMDMDECIIAIEEAINTISDDNIGISFSQIDKQ